MRVRPIVTRRSFLAALAAARPEIQTVTGSIRPDRLGTTLMHEHVIVDFGGTGKYDPEEVFAVALPHLKELRAAGCRTLVEPTPEHIGRDAAILRRLARASGLQIVCATGIYGAANHKFIPPFAPAETAEQLAARYEAEFRKGIGSTGIRPGIIKTGVNKAPLPEIERKLVRAAALAAKATGLHVASHTGSGAAALEQLDLLASAGVPASSFIWVHAQNEKNHDLHFQVARTGAWVEFDGLREASLDWHLECVRAMKGARLLGRTLVSHDAGWYHVGEPQGGNYRGYTLLFREFLPRLAFSPPDAYQLLVGNPRAALSPTA
jgi:phosphotriesterase-related protein